MKPLELRFLHKGEIPLACGIALLGVTAFLAPQVMIGLLALLLAPVVAALLLIGAWRAREPELSVGRRSVGFILLLLALSGLVMATGSAVDTSARAARLKQMREDRMRAVQSANLSAQPDDPVAAERRAQVEVELQALANHPAHAPPNPGWMAEAAVWLAPICMGLGLLCRAGWSLGRCLLWAGLVWVFPYGVTRLIQTFGPSMVLSA